VKRSGTGEGDRDAVEGATPDTVFEAAPSTMLRMVPLPRCAVEDQISSVTARTRTTPQTRVWSLDRNTSA
jgi:hypothetical protein